MSVQKGWNEVLPYARVLDDTLRTAATPDDEPQRNEQLLAVLAKLKVEVPEVQKSLDSLASKLAGTVPKSLTETCSRFTALTATTSFQEFDAAVRESYPTPADFAAAFDQYAKGRKLRDRAFELSSARDYLGGACDVDKNLEFDRKAHWNFLAFDSLLKDPGIIPARLEGFDQWKTKYTHAYRKAHRTYYEELKTLEENVEALRPQVRALALMNSIVELGPPLASTSNVTTDLATIVKRLNACVDAAEADVTGAEPTCPKCAWKPDVQTPAAEAAKLKNVVAAGLADRFQRFKDATIGAILKQAAEKEGRADLQKLMEIIQLANMDLLVSVITEELVEFLRKLLYDENLIQEEVPLGPIVQLIGAIEEDRIDEAVERFANLLTKAVKEAKSKHGKTKRVRVFLRLQDQAEGAE